MARKKILVEKRNILNDIIAREFTMQELRLFSIYLGRINPRNISTRQVRMPLKAFYRVMDLQPIRVEYLKDVTRNLLAKVVSVPTQKGGYDQFQLFKRCRVEKDVFDQWYIEIDAHDEALPLMFDYQRDYFTYELWNVLNLESTNQFRMYEILKQYEHIGVRVIAVDELKALLGIDEKQYPRYGDFKVRVLDSCQKALKANTDITYAYEPYAREGKGGKVTALRFTIKKNPDHVDKLDLESFLDPDALAAAKQEPAPAPRDVSGLGFITEPMTAADRQSVLRAADGDEPLVRAAYDMAKQQGGIDNLTAWLIAMIKKLQNGEAAPPISVKAPVRTNRFVNFEQREIDFTELERLELELLKASMNGVFQNDAILADKI